MDNEIFAKLNQLDIKRQEVLFNLDYITGKCKKEKSGMKMHWNKNI